MLYTLLKFTYIRNTWMKDLLHRRMHLEFWELTQSPTCFNNPYVQVQNPLARGIVFKNFMCIVITTMHVITYCDLHLTA